MERKEFSNIPINKWLIAVLVTICLATSLFNVFDNKTEVYLNGATKQAITAFAGARALNAAISVAQSAQVGVSLGGQASFHPGEILDPVNDMVEDYSTAMKYAIGSLISQKLIVEILSAQPIKWLLVILGLVLLPSLFLFNSKYINFLYKGFLFIGLLRFLMIITVLLVGWLDTVFITEKTNEGMAKVKQDLSIVEDINENIRKLSTQSSEEISLSLEGVKQRLQAINEDIDKQDTIISSREVELTSIEENYKDEVGIINRLNPLNDDEKKESIRGQLALAEAEYSKSKDDREKLVKERERLKGKLEGYEKILKGEGGIWSSLKSLKNVPSKVITVVKTFFNPQKMLEVFNTSIENMLVLIALFIFKTLILPVSFLFISLYGFKHLWGYDLRELISTKDEI